MLFTYKAKLKNGQIFEGTMEAADRFTLSRELRDKGDLPISIKEGKSSPFDLSNLTARFLSRVGLGELIIFTKNLSGMLKAGLSLSRALSVLKKQTKNPGFVNVLTALAGEIDAGGTLSSGFAKFPNVFSNLFVSMTKAGEESGNLSGALSEVGANLEKAYSLSRKVKGALIYPSVILSAMVLIGVLMFAFVVPTLASTFKELNVDLPASTKFIIALGNFFSEHLLISFTLIIGTAAGTVYLLKAPFMRKYTHFALIKLPIIGSMTKELNSARTARTMSSLLSSGVSITRAIEITGDVVQNIYYKKILEQAKEYIEKGSPFSKAFEENTNFYPIMMEEMTQVGEETGKLSEMLSQIASFYETEIENKTKNLSTIIEPVLMVIIGGAVGFFAVSMISPLYSVLDNIN